MAPVPNGPAGPLPSEGGMNDYINVYPFLAFPTTTAISSWAGAVLPSGPSLGAAALQQHSMTHARVLRDTLKAQGKAVDGRHLVRLRQIEQLREAWPAVG